MYIYIYIYIYIYTLKFRYISILTNLLKSSRRFIHIYIIYIYYIYKWSSTTQRVLKSHRSKMGVIYMQS